MRSGYIWLTFNYTYISYHGHLFKTSKNRIEHFLCHYTIWLDKRISQPDGGSRQSNQSWRATTVDQPEPAEEAHGHRASMLLTKPSCCEVIALTVRNCATEWEWSDRFKITGSQQTVVTTTGMWNISEPTMQQTLKQTGNSSRRAHRQKLLSASSRTPSLLAHSFQHWAIKNQ